LFFCVAILWRSFYNLALDKADTQYDLKAGGLMRYRLGITMGDPAGIGSEIIVKALSDRAIYDCCIPVVIGDLEALQRVIKYAPEILTINDIKSPEEAQGQFGIIDFIDLGVLKGQLWEYGKVQAICGEASFQYITTAIDLAMKGQLHAVVTAPINKEALNLAGHAFAGHTEIFAKYTDTKNYSMLLTARNLRVVHVTTHVSMRNACDIIRENPKRVEDTILLAKEAMHLLGNDSPKIAVAALNAHCSEHGLFGDEEEKSIEPAIAKCKAAGVNVEGPIPPDTVFVKAISGKYDIVVAMYHDQGHIPLKMVGFKLDAKTNKFTSMAGVNITVGLPIIRTSVDHGTAYGHAGMGFANEQSLLDAIYTAAAMSEVKFGNA